jgi:hypothetical protein
MAAEQGHDQPEQDDRTAERAREADPRPEQASGWARRRGRFGERRGGDIMVHHWWRNLGLERIAAMSASMTSSR